MHYTGWLKSGQKFDLSHDRGQPMVFPIGRDPVIDWKEPEHQPAAKRAVEEFLAKHTPR